MFDFLFGGKNKLNLVRELLEIRMRESGFDDLESRLKTKNLSNLQLMSTPEGTIVSIVELVLKFQKSGKLLFNILSTIENNRAKIGYDAGEFGRIFRLSKSSNVEEASTAVAEYCIYRAHLEHTRIISKKKIVRAMFLATNALTGFNVYSPEMVKQFEDHYDEM